MNIPMPIARTASLGQPSLRAARQSEKAELTRLQLLHSRTREEPAAVIFSPLAWLKLLLFLHAGETEVGGFGVSAENRPLYIDNFVTVKQSTSAVTVAFDDMAVADYFDDCIDRGLPPCRFARIWIHTHPGDSPQPSSVDEVTFQRVFGDCDWAVMLIVSRTQAAYARVSFSAGPGGSLLLPVKVDWAAWPQLLVDHGAALSDQFDGWLNEYGANICPVPLSAEPGGPNDRGEDRPSWKDELWREDDVYALHEQLEMEEEFARSFETAGREGR